MEKSSGSLPDPTNGALGVTYTITGLAWPETLGDWTLMGPANRLGSWRWYQRRIEINGAYVTERIKLDSQLQPIWESLLTIPSLQPSVPQKADNHVD